MPIPNQMRIGLNHAHYYLRRSKRLFVQELLRVGRRDDLQRSFVFLHIPKAGGTSLRHFFRLLVGERNVYPETRLNGNPSWDELDVHLHRAFLGHIGYRFAQAANAETATLLRHPVDRILSMYSYSMKPGKHPAPIGGIRQMSLEAFLQSDYPGITMNIDNAQTWQIAWGFVERERREFLSQRTENILTLAEQNLRNIDLVGTLENLDSFRAKAADYFKDARVGTIPIRNRSIERLHYVDISARAKTLIDGLVEKDLALYDLAGRL